METGSKILDYRKLHLFGFELAFDEFYRYQNLFENFLIEELEGLKRKFNEEDIEKEANTKGEFSREYLQYISVQWSEMHFDLSVVYPHNFRASFLIQLISFLENELKKISDFYYTRFKKEYSIADLKGNSDIEKSKKFFATSFKVDFDKLKVEWNYINYCRMIRNKIVHSQGVLSKKDNDWQQINEFIKNNESKITFKEALHGKDIAKFSELNLIIISKDLNSQLIQNIKLFFNKLLESLPK